VATLKKGTSRERISKNVARAIRAGKTQEQATRAAVTYANKQARQGK
jgi:hypothetical protein